MVQHTGANTAVSISDRLLFEAKRAKYSVGDSRRQSLLEEVGFYIGKLKSLLESCDRMAKSPASEPRSTSKIRRLYRSQLSYWRHAERAYNLVCKAWRCDCIAWHRASVWLGGLAAGSPITIRVIFNSHPPDEPSRKTWEARAMEIVAVDEFADSAPSGHIPATPAVRFATAPASHGTTTGQNT